jgi:hypothetical protein
MLISFGTFTVNFNKKSSDLIALLSHTFSHSPALHNCGIFHIMGCAFLWPVDRSLCPASLVIMWQWCGLSSTQRQAKKLIFGASLTTKTRLLSFNRTQSRVVTGLLTRHNTLRRHLHLMGLTISPLGRRCGGEEETSAHIVCECEVLASLRHTCRGSFFLDPED